MREVAKIFADCGLRTADCEGIYGLNKTDRRSVSFGFLRYRNFNKFILQT